MINFNANSNALLVYTINNPESVIEVYLDAETGMVHEVKSLNYNRTKHYSYTADEYLQRYAHHPAGEAISAALEGAAA